MKGFLAAIQFLTIFPVPARYYAGEKELEQSVIYFPLVGLLLGILLTLLDFVLCHFLPPLPESMIIVIAMAGVSGFMHLDGLADTADGFFSARPRERILEIMRDSRIGAMGAVALVCAIGLKWAALASIPAPLRWSAILIMPLAGRCTQIFGMSMIPYARSGGGMASVFTRGQQLSSRLIALAMFAGFAWLALGTLGLSAFALVLVMVIWFSRWCKSKIGGFTGDTLGTACELAEIIIALTAASFIYML